MSATVPETAADAPAEDSPSALRRPWPRFALRMGGSVLEVRGPTLFLRFAGFEAYLCTAEVSDWWTSREPGCFEAALGRFRLSAAKATTDHEP